MKYNKRGLQLGIVWSLQRSSAKFKPSHELPRPLDLDGQSVKPPKAKPKVQTQRSMPLLFLAQNNPSNLKAKILSMIDYLMKRNRRPLDHSLGFHSCPTQTSFKSPSPFSKSNHFKMRRSLDFGHSVKGREAELVVSCNLIGGNRWPLDLQP
jgi:hypothetical protein